MALTTNRELYETTGVTPLMGGKSEWLFVQDLHDIYHNLFFDYLAILCDVYLNSGHPRRYDTQDENEKKARRLRLF